MKVEEWISRLDAPHPQEIGAQLMKSILSYKLYTKLNFSFRKKRVGRSKCYLFAEIYGLGMAVKERSRNLSQCGRMVGCSMRSVVAVSREDQSALAGSEDFFVNLHVA